MIFLIPRKLVGTIRAMPSDEQTFYSDLRREKKRKKTCSGHFFIRRTSAIKKIVLL